MTNGMHTRAELVARVNALVWEGLYIYEDIAADFDEAIDEINAELNSTFPSFSEVMTLNDSTYSRIVDTVVTPYFPNKYMTNFVVNFVVAAVFRREAEFGNEYYTAVAQADKWLGNMFRDHFSKVPTEFQDTESGMIEMNPESEAVEDPLYPLDGTVDPLDQL
jgi:hypothetical protein